MRWWTSVSILILTSAALAGPVEFGQAELDRAIAERGLHPALFRFQAEIGSVPPETYRILPGRITGGDLRGLMYGLLDAAEQIRLTGIVLPSKGAPATPIRGIRCFLHNRDLEADWYYSREYWIDYFQMLARHRFNRFNLVFAHQTDYLAPPYPYWVTVDGYPEVRVPGLTAAQRVRNFEMLRFISDTAAEYGIDFTLGIWEHNVQRGMRPSVEGLTPEIIGPYSYRALKKVLAGCPRIRSVQMRTNSESGIPAGRQLEFFRDYVFKAVHEAGRRVYLDLRGWIMTGGLLQATIDARMPVRLSSKYWAEYLGRPYQPAETWPGYSYLNFLEKPRPYGFYWEVWALGSNRLLLWGDPAYVKRAVPTFTLSDSLGFEIDPPLAQKGFGNRPGKWGIFTDAARDHVFWKHEFERYWMFYLLWGRLSYDPKTPDRAWLGELKRRFGAAVPDVLDAYQNASRVLPEMVAAYMPDPNMYLWPEIDPGKRIDAYLDVQPSDRRLIASPREAAANLTRGVASAKQTPVETAAHLLNAALHAEQALGRARLKLAAATAEWRSTESDIQVLNALARYHACKQTAAAHLAVFEETRQAGELATAHRELRAGLDIWEHLAAFTDGLYPREMAYGPADTGHWRDKLPAVRRDLQWIDELGKTSQRPVAVAHWPKPVPRPQIAHLAPKSAPAGRPLTLFLRVYPTIAVKAIRLHYRPLNQLAKFKTLETTPPRSTFTIPAADVSPRWDLMYYFEILNTEKTGWFDPDPATATPYYVVRVESPADR